MLTTKDTPEQIARAYSEKCTKSLEQDVEQLKTDMYIVMQILQRIQENIAWLKKNET